MRATRIAFWDYLPRDLNRLGKLRAKLKGLLREALQNPHL